MDWWLVLMPSGAEWQALDEQPVYFMVGPVMERRQPGTYLRVMEAISRGIRPLLAAEGFDPATWAARLSKLPPDEAAREFDVAVVKGLGGTDRR